MTTTKVGESSKRPKQGGRQKGTPNKTTAALKDAVMSAFNEVGGQAYLVTVAREDPKTFITLLGKVLPSEIKADVALSFNHEEALADLA